MSGNVGSAISESGVVENVGVAAKTASKSSSVQKLFLLPVLVAAILNFGCRPLSDHVVSAISESGVVGNVGVAVGTASPSPSVHKSYLCFSLPHVDFRMLSRHVGTSGQSKRGAMTSSCRAFIQVIGISNCIFLSGVVRELWHVKWSGGQFPPPPFTVLVV